MLKILLNNNEIDLDDKTAIGLSIATYDISKPGTPLISISNNFSIPKTAKNLKAIGFAGSNYYLSTLPYEPIEVIIFDSSEILLYKAKARIEKITDRIELLIYQKENFWDEIKLLKVKDDINNLLAFINANNVNNKFTGNYASFLSKYKDSISGLIIPYSFCSLYPDSEVAGTQIYKTIDDSYGSHVFIFLKDIFRYIASKYSVDLGINAEIPGNIFLDDYFNSTIVFLPFLIIKNDGGYYFDAAVNEEIKGKKDIWKDITYFDIIEAAIKMFNIVIDYGFFDGNYAYRFYRFDSILEHAPLIDWSKNIEKIKEFSPIIENVEQLNKIKYKDVPEGFNELYAGKEIICKNKNINAVGDLIEIPCYAFGFVNDNGINVPNLSIDKAYNNLVLALLTEAKLSVLAKFENQETNIELYIPALFDLSNEYQLLGAIYEYPQKWVVSKWLSITDIVNFRNFAIYYIDILGGSFIVSKINNFTLTKKTSTDITLIKISDITITKDIETSYWVDGINNLFTDGQGNIFEYALN